MRFKDKFSRVGLRVSLIVMVALSIALSAIIWGSDARFSRIEGTSNQTQTKDLGQRSLRDIYLPCLLYTSDSADDRGTGYF